MTIGDLASGTGAEENDQQQVSTKKISMAAFAIHKHNHRMSRDRRLQSFSEILIGPSEYLVAPRAHL